MTTITFDTHKFIRTLKEAGVPESQAEAFSDAFKEAQGEAELASNMILPMCAETFPTYVEIWIPVLSSYSKD